MRDEGRCKHGMKDEREQWETADDVKDEKSAWMGNKGRKLHCFRLIGT